jgi:hypothetical protein
MRKSHAYGYSHGGSVIARGVGPDLGRVRFASTYGILQPVRGPVDGLFYAQAGNGSSMSDLGYIFADGDSECQRSRGLRACTSVPVQ